MLINHVEYVAVSRDIGDRQALEASEHSRAVTETTKRDFAQNVRVHGSLISSHQFVQLRIITPA